jgi:cytochrome c5
MRLHRPLLALALAPLFVAACGSDSKAVSTTAAPATTAPGPSASAPPSTVAPGTTMVDNTPTSIAEGPVQVDVVVGKDSGPDRVLKVKKGADITVNLTNPSAADEFHVHVVEMEQKVEPGVTATFNFTAYQVGTIEIESHVTKTVLLVIEVS